MSRRGEQIYRVLLIVDNFHFGRAAVRPFKAYAPLIVYTDAVLTGSFPLEFLQSVCRGRLQIAQFRRGSVIRECVKVYVDALGLVTKQVDQVKPVL